MSHDIFYYYVPFFAIKVNKIRSHGMGKLPRKLKLMHYEKKVEIIINSYIKMCDTHCLSVIP